MKKLGDDSDPPPPPHKPPPKKPPAPTPTPPAPPSTPTVDMNQMAIAMRQLIAQYGTYTRGGGKAAFKAWLQGQVATYLKNHPGAQTDADPQVDPIKWISKAYEIIHGTPLPEVLAVTIWEEVWGWLAQTSETLPGDIEKVLNTAGPSPTDAGVDDGDDEGDGQDMGAGDGTDGGGGGGCFAAGTLVATEHGLRAIETIGKDDHVVARSEHADVISVEPVLRTWVHAERATLVMRLANGESIRTTAPHRFYVGDRGFVAAKDLRAGDCVTTSANQAIAITAIEADTEAHTVYNLSVANAHTYFVGETQVWVHNVKDDGSNVDDGDDEGDDGETADAKVSVEKARHPVGDPSRKRPIKPGR